MKSLTSILLLLFFANCFGQDSTLVLSAKMFDENNSFQLAEKGQWIFKKGNDVSWADPNLNTADWDTLRPVDLKADMADENGRLEAWFRLKIKLDSSLEDSLTGMGLISEVWAASDVYINGKLFHSFGNTGINNQPFKAYNSLDKHPIFLEFLSDKEYLIAIHFVDKTAPYYWHKPLRSQLTLASFFTITTPYYFYQKTDLQTNRNRFNSGITTLLLTLVLLFWLIYFQNRKEKHLLMIALTVSFLFLTLLALTMEYYISLSYNYEVFFYYSSVLFILLFFAITPFTVAMILNKRIPKILWVFSAILLLTTCISIFFNLEFVQIILVVSSFVISAFYIVLARKNIKGANWALVIGLVLPVSYFLLFVSQTYFNFKIPLKFSLIIFYTTYPLSMMVYVSIWFKESRKAVETNAIKVIKITEEKKNLLASQNILLEQQVNERTAELNQSFENLKSTQSQLIHAEKMASLGELTAGIAHEIQNPLNFVNNFSEVSVDLMNEMDEEMTLGNTAEVKDIAGDLKQNLEKIHHHGQRASFIVQGMLEHSRTNPGDKKPTDINVLADEFLRLSYHGLRAKDKSFNAEIITEYDKDLPKINVVPQDIGRVLLNLFNNAFYAVGRGVEKIHEFSPPAPLTEFSPPAPPPQVGKDAMHRVSNHKPTVTLTTKTLGSKIEIRISDNGNGIPDAIKGKIFQPFFTTKPTGQGTGLGLSMSYDIITKGHGGDLKAESVEGAGTTFVIILSI